MTSTPASPPLVRPSWPRLLDGAVPAVTAGWSVKDWDVRRVLVLVLAENGVSESEGVEPVDAVDGRLSGTVAISTVRTLGITSLCAQYDPVDG